MWRLVVSAAALIAAASSPRLAAAQTLAPIVPWRAETEIIPLSSPPIFFNAPVGFLLSPGTTFVPEAFTEIGYDSNPYELFNNAKGSGFSRTGVGFSVNSVSPGLVASLGASGSMMNYFNDTLIEDPNRFAGSVRGSVAYQVQPGVTFAAAGFDTYDNQAIVNPTQTNGASAEIALRDPGIASYLRVRTQDVNYLNPFNQASIATPVSLSSVFNFNRSDVIAGALFLPSSTVAPYAEASAARIQYTDQPDPSLIDRSADDYYAKGGLRFGLSPFFSADVGWRFNERTPDAATVSSYRSNFFDGGVTWRPSPFFLFAGTVERAIVEPTTDFAILSDARIYTFKITYLPVGGVAINFAAGFQDSTEIPTHVHYHSNFGDLLVSWDYNNHVQFYTNFHYQTYEFDWQNLEYEAFRVMVGIRIIPDGQDLLNGESLQSLFARLSNSARPAYGALEVWGGYSWFTLPSIKMATVVGGPFFDRAVGQITNDNGDLTGWRTDLRLADFARSPLPGGNEVSFGLSGFFSNYQSSSSSHCTYSLTTDCAFVNIIDFDPNQANNTGPFGNLNIKTSRNVNYYGVALDAHLGSWLGGSLKDWTGSLKDAPVALAASPFYVGIGMRGLDETAKLTSVDPLVCDPVTYKETLNTHYYGGFIGVDEKGALGDGWAVNLNATAGVYYADTEYQGRYSGYAPVIGVGYVQDQGNLNESLDKASFIGTVRLGLDRSLGWGRLGIFAQAEYLSYVPRIVYNNNDQASVLSFPIAGTQYGTQIKSSDAFNYTTGVSLVLPVN